jgi:hypothetical protein
MYNTIDYQNALWGKEIFTLQALDVRAEILKDIFPDIKEKTDKLIESIALYNPVEKTYLYNMNQRAFNKWLTDVFAVLKQSAELVKAYFNHEKDDCPIVRLGERDINRTSLLGAYKNQEDETMFTTIDNIVFIVTDVALGFNPSESYYGILAKYISINVPKFKKIPINDISSALQQVTAKYIMDDEYKEDKEIYFKIVDDITFLKE